MGSAVSSGAVVFPFLLFANGFCDIFSNGLNMKNGQNLDQNLPSSPVKFSVVIFKLFNWKRWESKQRRTCKILIKIRHRWCAVSTWKRGLGTDRTHRFSSTLRNSEFSLRSLTAIIYRSEKNFVKKLTIRTTVPPWLPSLVTLPV